MTNAEKYLKDNASVEELVIEFEEFCKMLNENCVVLTYSQEMEQFLYCERQDTHTLTEDERVILRNIPKEFTTIARNLVGELSARNKDTWRYADVFNHLFQFIKERRRIRDKGVIKMNIVELLEKIENGEIKDDTIFYGGDLFYKLIVVDKKLYVLNTHCNEFQFVDSHLIGSFIKNKYKIYEYKMVLD